MHLLKLCKLLPLRACMAATISVCKNRRWSSRLVTLQQVAAVAASQRHHQAATQSYPPCLVCAITVLTHGTARANGLVLSGTRERSLCYVRVT